MRQGQGQEMEMEMLEQAGGRLTDSWHDAE